MNRFPVSLRHVQLSFNECARAVEDFWLNFNLALQAQTHQTQYNAWRGITDLALLELVTTAHVCVNSPLDIDSLLRSAYGFRAYFERKTRSPSDAAPFGLSSLRKTLV